MEVAASRDHSRSFVMGLAIVTLYVVSALAGAAGIGRQELRR
jgi:hypothetical protein